MSSKIVVTGLGIISAIGRNPEETFNSLINKKSGITLISILNTIHKNEIVVGEIKLTHEELTQLAGVNKNESWTRTALLAIIAAKQAYKDAGLEEKDQFKTGLISATTVGGMDRSEILYRDFLSQEEFNPYIDTHHAGNSTESIASHLNITGFISTISTACSSSLNSIMFGARLIKSGKLDRVIVGGTDALSKFTLNGFNTLMILDKHLCRPFDATRTGLNLGEAAAYMVLEKEDIAIEKGKKIYAELSGYANANDAFHQTASSGEGTGPFLAMKNALDVAHLQPSDIDYINVHGTGTENNDLTEGRAIQRLFKDVVPEFSSTKAYTGHTLGAAGAVESIISILALNNNMVFPNINFKNRIEELNIQPETEIKSKPIQHVLTNSFGFGGNDSSLVFSKSQKSEVGSRKSGDGGGVFSPFGGDTEGVDKDLRLKNQEPRIKNQDLRPKTEDLRLETRDSKLKTQDSELQTPVYINGMGCVAPQETLDSESFLEKISSVSEKYLQMVKPNFREYIDPKSLRRMSKIVRMGIVAAKTAMSEAGIEKSDAIITGTGMGCQADTEKFLNSMIDNNETLLTPTAFIQSTHNTIGAQIALLSGNNNYNLAYVHRTFSFETALVDSLLFLQENNSAKVLLGGVDEITEESWKIKTHINYFKKEETDNLEILENKEVGALAGESASFFVLSHKKTDQSYAEIKGVDTFFQPSLQLEVHERIASFLEKNNLPAENVDLVLLGYNGDAEFDEIYNNISASLFSQSNIGYFKHLCGEHDTASAFATWIASGIFKNHRVPEIIMKEKRSDDQPRTILIYNHFRNINHSLILLEKA